MDFCTKLLNIEDRRTQRLHDLASDGGFVALKRAAEDRGTEKQKKDVKNLLSSRRLLLKDDGGGGDNWNYKTCKTAVKTSSATIQQLVFFQAGCHLVAYHHSVVIPYTMSTESKPNFLLL